MLLQTMICIEHVDHLRLQINPTALVLLGSHARHRGFMQHNNQQTQCLEGQMDQQGITKSGGHRVSNLECQRSRSVSCTWAASHLPMHAQMHAFSQL